MDPRALWLSVTFAAAKLAIGLWFGQLVLSVLDRRRATLAWQIGLSAATIVVSWWALRTSGVPQWWAPAWVTSSLLAAAVLVDCVRRWLSMPLSDESQIASRKSARAEHGSQRVHDLICLVGWAVALTASGVAILASLPPETLARAVAVLQLSLSAGLLGIALAASVELTIGATGAVLLSLNWGRLAYMTTVFLLMQLGISTFLIVLHPAGETLADSLTPIFFALGMVMVSYIVWAIPRQMVVLAAKGRMEGQASLAVAGWLAVICLLVVCGLPPAWPWTQVRAGARGLSQPVLPSR